MGIYYLHIYTYYIDTLFKFIHIYIQKYAIYSELKCSYTSLT